MLVACWSVKGGCGTSVIATALALVAARRTSTDVLLVDLAGDLPAICGLPTRGQPGLADWLTAGDDVGVEALHRLEVPVPGSPRVRLLPRGEAVLAPAPGMGDRMFTALTQGMRSGTTGAREVVVDCGRVDGVPDRDAAALAVIASADVSLLVLRPCYLALRRATEAPVRATSIVLVQEPGRALRAVDVEQTLGVPVRAVVPLRPDIARAVDAGLSTSRLPRRLAAAVRRAAT